MRAHAIVVAIAVFLSLLLVWLFGLVNVQSAPPAPEEEESRVVFELPVTGWASVAASPDRAVVTMGVTTEGETASDAVTANNDAMQAVFETLEAYGVSGGDLNTRNFRVIPVYQTELDENERPVIVAFQVQNTLEATFNDLSRMGPAMDAAFQSGSNRLVGVRFVVTERRAIQARSQADAIIDARAQAERIAEAAGLELGRLVGMNVGAGPSTSGETFVITGSRIARSDVTSDNPVTIVSGQELRSSGLANLGQSLRQTLASGDDGFNEGGAGAPQMSEAEGEIPVGAVAISAGDQEITSSVTLNFEFLRPEED